MPSGIDTVQLEFQARLKREKRRLPKSGQRSTSDMHSNCCIPGTRQSYDGHYDDYMFASGTPQRNECRNCYDRGELQTKLFKQLVQSWTHAESVACGRDQALAA